MMLIDKDNDKGGDDNDEDGGVGDNDGATHVSLFPGFPCLNLGGRATAHFAQSLRSDQHKLLSPIQVPNASASSAAHDFELFLKVPAIGRL